MKRALIVFGICMLLAPVANALLPIAYAQHQAVTICHRTGSSGNAFVVITTDNQSIIQAHVGPVPHPPRSGRADILLPIPNGTVEDCRNADDGGDDGGDDV